MSSSGPYRSGKPFASMAAIMPTPMNDQAVRRAGIHIPDPAKAPEQYTDRGPFVTVGMDLGSKPDQCVITCDGRSVFTHDLDGKPRNRRKVSKELTRLRVLDAARFLFTNVGYFDTGIRDVAQRIGMSTGAVFATVDSKENLWREAMGGPPPSEPLAEEVALILARYPGWRWLMRFNGTDYLTSLSHPEANPLRHSAPRIYTGHGDSPAAALRDARQSAERLDSPDGRQ